MLALRRNMKTIALKVDVDTFRGTREGVPRLLGALRARNVTATFLFSLGPDHTGRAIKRAFRPGFLSKVQRTSVREHYGIKTLLYGTLLPGPDIGRTCAANMRAVRDAGHEVGIHCWDHVRWQDGVATANETWTRNEMERAIERFQHVLGEPPRTHGAAGWQMNRHALRLTQRLGFTYCSDGRGTSPFIPVIDAEIIDCPQIPTTLPTMDELIGTDGVNESNVDSAILAASDAPGDHVFTLHAELEGGKLLPAFERLLDAWIARGWRLVTTRTVFDALDREHLPLHSVLQGTVPGRSGTLLVQGKPFPTPFAESRKLEWLVH